MLSSFAPAQAASHPPADHSAIDTGASSDPSPLALVHQTAFVPNQIFAVQVRTGAGLPPATGLALDVSVYDCVYARSNLEQISSNGPSSDDRLGSTGALGLNALPVVAGADGNGPAYQVSVGLNVDGVSPTAAFNGSSIDLSSCERSGSGSADAGVYPATVTLENPTTHHVFAQFTTYFADVEGTPTPPAGKRLRVAVVVPVGAPVTPDSSARAGSAAALPSRQADRLAQVVATVASRAPTAPVTVNATPQTVEDLAATGKSGPATLRLLQQVVLRDEALDQPYVPIDADTMAASGLGSEVSAQKNRGHQVLLLSGIHTDAGVWLAQQTVDGGAADAVAALEAQRAVVPASSFESAPSGGFTNPFMLSLGHGGEIPTAASDTALTREFSADPRDPALAAYQMIADLELVYWELPNSDQARGVVAVPPTSWQADPTFLNTLLSTLSPSPSPSASGNPYLQPVTLSDFFSQVPLESSDGGRSLAGGNGTDLPSSFVSAVKHTRGKLDSFTSTTSGAGSVISQLGDALLSAESSELSSQGRSVALQGFNSALGAQLSQIQLTTDRTITLTSRTAALPVTILSSAPYTVHAVLSLSSAKLEFPAPGSSGSTGPSKTEQLVVIDRSTTALRVQVVTRTSGDLPVSVSLTSLDGALVLVRGRLTVRSTAFSVVGVVLTALALAVLLGWWVRSSISRRRGRAAQGQPPHP